jgi:GT2 family glycosyltransferase
MTPALDCAVIVCAYTQERWLSLVSAIDSLKRQTSPPAEIVLVVDHNSALARRAAGFFRDVAVVENAGARGLSGARNTGIAASRAEIVAFIDDDAVAEPQWLATLLAWYADPGVIAVGGSVNARWIGQRPPWLPVEFDWVIGCSYTGVPEDAAAPVRNLLGANMSFRREVFARVGGFRSGIGRIGAAPFGCEETELCIRARRAWPHGAVIYDPAARVAHTVTRGRASWRYFRARCYAEGVSKAAVARIAGREDALASERRYVKRTLTSAIVRYAATAMRGDGTAAQKIAAIAAGLLLTCAGFAHGAFLRRTDVAYDITPAPDVA